MCRRHPGKIFTTSYSDLTLAIAKEIVQFPLKLSFSDSKIVTVGDPSSCRAFGSFIVHLLKAKLNMSVKSFQAMPFLNHFK